MKNILLLLTSLLILKTSNAQTVNAYNPLLQNLHFNPEPNTFGFQNCSETFAKFNFGMTTQANADLFATQPLKINIALQGFFPANINPAIAVSGSHAGYFNWTYDILTNSLQGIQSSTLYGTGSNIFNLDPRAFGEIIVRLQIPAYLPVPVTLGVDASLDIPAYMLVGNTLDDQASVQTQNYIGYTSLTGTLFNDTGNNNTPAGIPSGLPDNNPIFVNVIDDLSGLVEDNVQINSNGSYLIDSLRPDRNYTVTISTVQAVNGQSAPPIALPINWINVNEDCCDNNSNDGLANGILSVYASFCDLTNANFAISKTSPLVTTELNQLNIALSVNELNFQVVERECSALLFWNNTAENNYQRYEIMRKEKTTSDFIKVGDIKATTNALDNEQYSFINKNDIEQNKVYQYQLRMIDINEKTFISPTKTISLYCNEENPVATLYPNPASRNINFLYENKNDADNISLHIIDVAGRTVLNKNVDIISGENSLRLDISDFPTGYYMLQYQDIENTTMGTLKFMVK